MSYSYKEFPNDVISAFESIIEKHDLHIAQKEDFYVVLSNRYVEVSFEFDRGDLNSELKRKDDEAGFGIYQVYKHLYGNIAEEKLKKAKFGSKQLGYPKTDLMLLAKLFENELSSILTGDFKWYKELHSEKESKE